MGDTVDSLIEVASNDDGCDAQSSVTFHATADTSYRIAVDGAGGATGTFSLAWSLLAQPANDDFVDGEAVLGTGGTIGGSNVAATAEQGEPDDAGVSAPIQSVWYSWTAPADGPVTIDTCGSGLDTALGVYTGVAVDALTEVASNDDACGSQSLVAFDAVAGSTYLISVDGRGDQVGAFLLDVTVG